MTDQNTTTRSCLPHHKLVAYRVAVELLLAVKAANVRDAKLRDEATRAAKSACLNAAEGAGRVTRPDKARALSAGETRPAPSAVLRHALFAARVASSRSLASRTFAAFTASSSCTAA